MRDQPIHRQPAGLEQVDVMRNVARRHRRAQVTAFQGALFGDQIHRRHIEGVRGRWQAAGDGGAAAPIKSAIP